MFRITFITGVYYAKQIKYIDDAGDIEELISDGSPIIIVQDLGDVCVMGIDPSDIVLVD